MTASPAELAAERLRNAYRDGPIASTREWLQEPTADLAYRIQEINTRHWVASGRRVVGRKIGLTSQAIQQQLNVDQPDFGILFADMEIASGAEASMSRLLQPRAEAEIAFVLQTDLKEPQPTLTDISRAIAYAVPAIEIVDSRIRDWKINLVDTISDNASSGLYVVGTDPRPLTSLDLRLCGMVLTKNDTVASVGVGAACLGHPLHAVQWLARTMVEKERPLQAGDIVLSGALGPMTAVAKGDVVCAEIAGVGSVSVRFA